MMEAKSSSLHLSLSLSLSVSDVDTMTSQAAAAGCCLTVEDANETTNEPTGILTTWRYTLCLTSASICYAAHRPLAFRHCYKRWSKK